MARSVVRKTKIIATIGPASDDADTIKAMINAGMNIARLNFSHGTHDEHRSRIEALRAAARELGAPLGIILDTRGTEIRTGRVEGGEALLPAGEPFTLYTDGRIGDASGVAISHATIAEDVAPGSRILFDDGAIELRVEAIGDREVRCVIIRGGRLLDHKGVNIPDVSLPHTDLSAQDREDIRFAIEHEIVYIAASFVRDAQDIVAIRRILDENGARIPIIAKIENRAGVENLDAGSRCLEMLGRDRAAAADHELCASRRGEQRADQ